MDRIITINQAFSTWDDVEDAIKKYEDASGFKYTKQNTQTVESANKSLPQGCASFPVSDDFKYVSCRFTCKHFGKWASTSTGIRPNQKTYKTGCESKIYVKLDKKKRRYIVGSIVTEHNHDARSEKADAILSPNIRVKTSKNNTIKLKTKTEPIQLFAEHGHVISPDETDRVLATHVEDKTKHNGDIELNAEGEQEKGSSNMIAQTYTFEGDLTANQAFSSWDDVEEAIKKYEDATGFMYTKHNTETVETANRRLPQGSTLYPVGDSFKYLSCKFGCKQFVGKASTSNQKTNKSRCKSKIYIKLDKIRREYIVGNIVKEHTHDISTETDTMVTHDIKPRTSKTTPTEHFSDSNWMANSMKDLYSMFMMDEFCDCLIAFTKTGSGLTAHKLLLGAHSEVLKAHLLETKENMARLDNYGIKLSIWRHILGYIYTGNVQCSKKEIRRIQEACDILQMTKLKELLQNDTGKTSSTGITIKVDIEDSNTTFEEDSIPLSDETISPNVVDPSLHGHGYQSQRSIEVRSQQNAIPFDSPNNVLNKPLKYLNRKRKTIPSTIGDNNVDQTKQKKAKGEETIPVPIDDEKIQIAKQIIEQMNVEQTVKQTGKYQCRMCQYVCAHRSRMVSHMMKKHRVTQSGLADAMEQTLIESTIRHVREEDIIMGTVENQERVVSADVQSEMDTAVANLEHDNKSSHINEVPSQSSNQTLTTVETLVQYKCPDCYKWFPNWRSRIRHLQRQHNVIEKYENGTSFPDFAKPSCSKCGKVFATEMKRNYHEAKHNSLICEICGTAGFPRPSDLKEHIEAKHGQLPKGAYKCHLCSAAFTYAKGLVRHLSQKHDTKAKFEKTQYKAESRENPKPKCKECGKTFYSKVKRDDHYYNVHLNQENPNLNKFQCHICQKVLKYGNKASIKKHLELHVTAVESGKVYECAGCKSKFKFKSELNIHTRLCKVNTDQHGGNKNTPSTGGAIDLEYSNGGIIETAPIIIQTAVNVD